MTDRTQPPDLSGLMQAAFDASPHGVLVTSAEAGVVFSNKAAEEILGLTAEELLGRTPDDPRWVVTQPDGTPFEPEERPSALARREGGMTDGLAVVGRPDGGNRWITIHAQPLPGVLSGDAVAVFFTDVTEQHELAVELQRSESRRQRAAEMASVGLWEVDVATGEAWHDATIAGLLGLGPAESTEVSSPGWSAALHPDDAERVHQQVAIVVASGGEVEMTYRLVRPDGEIRWVLDHVRALEVDESGASTRIGGAVVDVTAVKQADERVMSLLESMIDAYIAVGEDWRVSYVNREAERLMRAPREQLLGNILWEAVPGLLGGQIEVGYRKLLETGERFTAEYYYEPFDNWYEVSAHRTESGLASFFRVVTERHVAQAEREDLLTAERKARRTAERARVELEYATSHDALTGLPNRTGLNAWLERSVAAEDGQMTAVCFLDLDRFKLVNDSHGHVEGDKLLVAVGRRLRSMLARPDDLVARSSGDEFLVGVRGSSEEEILRVAHHLLDGLREPFKVADRDLVVGVCIGVAFANTASSAETLLRDADTALYRAKDLGRNRIMVFDDDLRHEIVRRLELESDLRDALAGEGQLVLHYQPIYRLSSSRAGAVEALVRWHHPSLGRLAPDRFIPLAEDSGLIVALGDAVLGMAASVARQWVDEGGGMPARVWVNASVRQLELPGFPARVLEVIADAGLPAGSLGIEVTESTLIEDHAFIAGALAELSAGGVPIAIDDFGTGYSSLARLSQYPVDLLKIDRSFVAGLDDGSSRPVVLAIIQMAHALGAQVCAEGVETPAQLAALRELGADWASGYYLAMPTPASEVPVAANAGSELLERGAANGVGPGQMSGGAAGSGPAEAGPTPGSGARAGVQPSH